MNPTVQTMPESLVSEEEPAAVKYAATSPKTLKPLAMPKPCISPLSEKGAAADPFSTDADPTDEAIPGKESVAKLGRDDRRSARSLVPKDRQACQLKVGASAFPALLVDKSAGGFAILIDSLDGLKAGKKIELHTDVGRFKVRIVYINTVARPKDAASECDSWFRIGLRKARSFHLF